VGDRLPEAPLAVDHRRRSRTAPDLQDLPAALPSSPADVLAHLLADDPVVRADVQRVPVALHGAVEQHHGNQRVGLVDDRREGGGVDGRDDEEVDPRVQELPHVPDLAVGGIRRVGEDHAEVGVARGLGADLLVSS